MIKRHTNVQQRHCRTYRSLIQVYMCGKRVHEGKVEVASKEIIKIRYIDGFRPAEHKSSYTVVAGHFATYHRTAQKVWHR